MTTVAIYLVANNNAWQWLACCWLTIPILLMDEPWVHLDDENAARINSISQATVFGPNPNIGKSSDGEPRLDQQQVQPRN